MESRVRARCTVINHSSARYRYFASPRLDLSQGSKGSKGS